MAKKETSDTVEDRVTALEAAITDLSAWRRRASDNWKRFVQTGAAGPATLEKGSDGKLAFSSTRILVALGLCSLALTGIVALAGVTVDPSQTDSYISDGSRFRVNTNGDVYTKGAIYSDGSIVSGGGVYTNAGVTTSNANGIVYASNITATTTITLPAAGIASAALPAIIGASAFSNITGRVNCSNLYVTAGSSVTVPAASIPYVSLGSPVAGTCYTNAQAGWTNIFNAYGLLISHNP
jgi:hypothetical protein